MICPELARIPVAGLAGQRQRGPGFLADAAVISWQRLRDTHVVIG
jgi:hypothetical protein